MDFVFNCYATDFGGCDQPVITVIVAAKHGGKQTDQLFAADRRAKVMPNAAPVDVHFKLSADHLSGLDGNAFGLGRRGSGP